MTFNKNIFINCPFDKEYKSLLYALLFTIVECGFEPRIASESSDSGEIRVEKIKRLIKESCFSIHDICRIEPSASEGLPRFNMPFELGLDLGCKFFGFRKLKEKRCLILEKEKYRYQKVLSDISGNDIKAHNNDPQILIRKVRDWIRETIISDGTRIYGSGKIWQRFNEFYSHFEIAAEKEGYDSSDREEISAKDFIGFIKDWIKNNPK